VIRANGGIKSYAEKGDTFPKNWTREMLVFAALTEDQRAEW